MVVVLCGALCAEPARADVPVPAHKPMQELKDSGYSFRSMALSLLDFGADKAPVPKPKPFIAGDQPLSELDITRYKNIFLLQEQGKIQEADRVLKRLSNNRLRGHVLYQRYMHPTAYRSSFEELRSWLTLYADYPGARRIYALAERKKPKGSGAKLRRPVSARGIARVADPTIYEGREYQAQMERSRDDKAAIKAVRRAVLSLVNGGETGQAAALLRDDKRTRLMDETERDILRGRIAAGYLYQGKTEQAQNLAVMAAKRSGQYAPLAGWIAGLSFWQEGQYRNAAKYFEVTARSPYSSGWFAAGGAYWAARSHMRAGKVVAVSKWLKQAAAHPRTFYGLIATRALGHDFEFNWDMPDFTSDHQQLLVQTKTGIRAMDLANVAQIHLAEAELLRINPGRDKEMQTAFLAYAGHARMPALALRFGTHSQAADGQSRDAALYPVGAWLPQERYKIDPALIHAIIRQESKFETMAQSHSGALGLMQLMPRTARAMADMRNPTLSDPKTNLEIGQKYLGHLLKNKTIDGDLPSLLIAYNAGPGNLARWRKRWSDVEDPLLFIELIPARETRSYVERVLSNYWIYQMRDDLDTPSLDAVVEGRKARYAYKAQDGAAIKLADKN